MATLALFVVSATFFCIIVGYALVSQADDRQSLERRAALLGAIEDIRGSGADFATLDARHIKGMERTAGLKDLRFETEPVAGDREIQSVLSRNGRIIGWFSWEPDRSMSNALSQLRPLLALTGVFLVGFAGIALWQVRRAVGDLGKSEQLAWTLAHEDMLTGLPNHRKMIELIDGALAARAHGEVVTLALLDLDGLKDINDALGHRIGDELLKALAARIKDMPAAARVLRPLRRRRIRGGDDRAGCGSGRGRDGVAGRRAGAAVLDQRAGRAGRRHGGPCACAARRAEPRRTDAPRRSRAPRRQEEAARRRCCISSRAMDVEFDDRRFLEKELRRALDEKALDVHYQPIVSADGNRIVGAEALLRWTHPERGAIPPMQFVAVAEQCRPDGAARRIRAAPRARRRQALAGPLHGGQPFAGAGARSGAGRTRVRHAGQKRRRRRPG